MQEPAKKSRTKSSGQGISVARLGVWSRARASSLPAQVKENRPRPGVGGSAERRLQFVEVEFVLDEDFGEKLAELGDPLGEDVARRGGDGFIYSPWAAHQCLRFEKGYPFARQLVERSQQGKHRRRRSRRRGRGGHHRLGAKAAEWLARTTAWLAKETRAASVPCRATHSGAGCPRGRSG